MAQSCHTLGATSLLLFHTAVACPAAVCKGGKVLPPFKQRFESSLEKVSNCYLFSENS
jgi:hypothetical protein